MRRALGGRCRPGVRRPRRPGASRPPARPYSGRPRRPRPFPDPRWPGPARAGPAVRDGSTRRPGSRRSPRRGRRAPGGPCPPCRRVRPVPHRVPGHRTARAAASSCPGRSHPRRPSATGERPSRRCRPAQGVRRGRPGSREPGCGRRSRREAARSCRCPEGVRVPAGFLQEMAPPCAPQLVSEPGSTTTPPGLTTGTAGTGKRRTRCRAVRRGGGASGSRHLHTRRSCYTSPVSETVPCLRARSRPGGRRASR